MVDGEKGVEEVLKSDFKIVMLLVTQSYLDKKPDSLTPLQTDPILISEKQMAQLSSFQTNESAMAVVRQKPNHIPTLGDDEFALALDEIRDPGNLGSIIRTADWFGIRKIIASEHSADFYNPKVINATMGSFTRVQFAYCDLQKTISQFKAKVFGALMDGDNVRVASFGNRGVIVIGNEANGISSPIQALVTHRITIPGVEGAESLNAAIATGIVLDNWSRLKK